MNKTTVIFTINEKALLSAILINIKYFKKIWFSSKIFIADTYIKCEQMLQGAPSAVRMFSYGEDRAEKLTEQNGLSIEGNPLYI